MSVVTNFELSVLLSESLILLVPRISVSGYGYLCLVLCLSKLRIHVCVWPDVVPASAGTVEDVPAGEEDGVPGGDVDDASPGEEDVEPEG